MRFRSEQQGSTDCIEASIGRVGASPHVQLVPLLTALALPIRRGSAIRFLHGAYHMTAPFGVLQPDARTATPERTAYAECGMRNGPFWGRWDDVQ